MVREWRPTSRQQLKVRVSSSPATPSLCLAGKGTQVWGKSGAIYDGDWRAGLRHGFGTLSTREGDVHMKKYAGGWKNDMRHVRPTVVCTSRERIVVMPSISLLHPSQGYGTNFYSPEEYYEGEWYADKRSGWGRMFYADGSVYEGEWYDDKRNGKGLLRLRKYLHRSRATLAFSLQLLYQLLSPPPLPLSCSQWQPV